jgi:hypothetical protein
MAGENADREGNGRPAERERRRAKPWEEDDAMTKKQFTLYLENRPGILASIAARLAAAKVNIEGISVSASTDVALVQIVPSNAGATRRVLRSEAVAYTEQDVAVVPLQNEPGALARVAAKLAKGGVNINYIYATTCECKSGCSTTAIISAPDLADVEAAWKAGK